MRTSRALLPALLAAVVAVPLAAVLQGSAGAASCIMPTPSMPPPSASGPAQASPSAAPSPTTTATATATATASPAPVPPDCPAGVLLGPDDDGTTVAVPVGHGLVLNLPGDWQAPEQSRPAPLFRTSLYASSSVLFAQYDVPAEGDVDLTAEAVDGSRTWSVHLHPVPTTGASPSPDPSPSGDCYRPTYPSQYGTTMLDERDNGATVTVRTGDPVVVVLGGDCAGRVWRAPRTPAGLLRDSVSESLQQTMLNYRPSTPGDVALAATDDRRCFHTTPACLVPSSLWRVGLHVVPKPPCDPKALLSAPPTVPAGSRVVVGGRAYGPVSVLFRNNGTFEQRRLLEPSGQTWSTTYLAARDERFFVRSEGCTSRELVVKVLPVTRGPAAVRRGSRVVLTVTGQADVPVQVLFRARGATSFTVRRTGRMDASGRFSTSYVAATDQRWYARTGAGRTGPAGLTQVR